MPRCRKDKPIAVDLFSGCGGLTAGLRQAGYRVAAAVEIDPQATATYRLNHRNVMVWQADIQNLHPAEILEKLKLKPGDIALLAGCPPCQGFSTLRTLNGAVEVDDPRNNLLQNFQKFVEVLQPQAVMMENVPRLAGDALFDAFCMRMQKLKYVGEHRILDAADYGVPQRRRRLIYLAGLGRELPFGKKARKVLTVREVLKGLPKAGKSGDPVHDIPERRSQRVREIIRLIPKNGGSRSQLPTEFQLECHKRCDGFRDIYGRMAWDDVAPTITSGCFNPSKGRFLHPREDRAITLREAALLQGFPPNYKFTPNVGKEALAAMIGNALPPPFIASHARSILRAFGEKGRDHGGQKATNRRQRKSGGG